MHSFKSLIIGRHYLMTAAFAFVRADADLKLQCV